MAKCAAITKDGGACKGVPIEGSPYCYAHHPDHAEDRRRYGSRGGKLGGRGRTSPVSSELARLQQVFEKLAGDVLEGRAERGAAAVAIQALNGARGCLVGALKAKEQEEMAQELAEITQTLQERGIKWRA
jgi:hypothetical protein